MMDKDSVDYSASAPLQPNGADKATTIVVGPKTRRPLQVDLQFSNVCYSVPRRIGKWKEILQNVTGELKSGRLTAILGPSGAGKTSLLNLLASRGGRGHRSSLRGNLKLNGVSYQEQPELFRRLNICYIPQEFALMPLLTTRETIYVAAKLKLPDKSYDTAAREYIIQDVADRLGLLNCMDTLASNLSGGEKKRLSIAVEMIISPSVMLLDEPTSGLDSTSSNQMHARRLIHRGRIPVANFIGFIFTEISNGHISLGAGHFSSDLNGHEITKVNSMYFSLLNTNFKDGMSKSGQVISLLCSMAHSGCTVASAVHQPSSQMTCRFDDLLVMSQGRCRYCGPRERVLDHFREAGFICPPFYNLAEFVLEVVTGQRGNHYERLCSKDPMNGVNGDTIYSSWSTPNCESTRKVKRYAVPYWEQYKILMYRAFICIIRDNTLTNLRLCAHLVVAVLLGLVFYNFGQDATKVQSNIACVFFFAIFLFFANSMPSVQMFPTEAKVFLRENTNNWYSLGSYYITKVLSDLPLQIVCPSIFLSIAYYMTGQPLEATRFFQVWLICTSFTILAQSFGIVTGAAFNTNAGMFLVPAFNIPMFLFAGFFLKLGEIPSYLRFFSVISYFRYVFEGILQAIYIDRPKLPCSLEFCYLRNPSQILSELQMPSMPYYITVFALCAWIAVLHLLTYGILSWKLHVIKR